MAEHVEHDDRKKTSSSVGNASRYNLSYLIIGIISLCWIFGSLVGFLPLFGWHNDVGKDRCYFTEKMANSYLVFLFFATIITPSVVLAVFYGLIYRVILKQVRIDIEIAT